MIKTLVSILVLGLLVTTGCGDGGAAVLKRRNDLEQLGIAYRDYHKAHSVAPTDASQLLEQIRQADPTTEEAASAAIALEEGDVTMLWDAQLENLDLSSPCVLGFEAGAPAHGGYVLMASGEVKLMKRGEFESATMVAQDSPTQTN